MGVLFSEMFIGKIEINFRRFFYGGGFVLF